MRSWLVLLAAPTAALVAIGCAGGPCTATELEAALAEAAPGEVVRVGACRITGSFVLPAGVSLEGQSGSVLTSAGPEPVIDAPAGAVDVRALRVEVDHGGVGIRARGGAELALRDVTVVVTRGVGVGVDGGALTVEGLTLEGPITEENAAFAPMSSAETATFGLVSRDTGDRAVHLSDVHVRGFAVAGVSIGGGVLTWDGRADGPDVEGCRGVGIALFGTRATLTSVEVAAMFSGVGMPGIAVVASALAGRGTELDASALEAHDGDGYGLFADGSNVALTGARFADLGLMGVRLQGGSLGATDLVAERNGGAGLLAVDATSVQIERGRFDGQTEALFVSALGSVRVADGIEIVRDPETIGAPPIDLVLTDVSLSANARAGLLVDAADGAITRLALSGVMVSADGAAYGAITQRAGVAAGWDAMITRAGAAAANDPAFSGTVDVVGIMMPPGLVATPPSL